MAVMDATRSKAPFRSQRLGVLVGCAAVCLIAVACGGASDARTVVGLTAGSGWTEPIVSPFEVQPNDLVNTRAVWTGREMIIPGLGPSPAFNPSTGTWRLTSAPPVNAVLDTVPLPAVWTGREMIKFDRAALDHAPTHDDETGPLVGLAYDPTNDSWRRIADAPAQRSFTTVVWTGTQLLVWGNRSGVSSYDPTIDQWREIVKTCGSGCSVDYAAAS
jgi:hypothetical protein